MKIRAVVMVALAFVMTGIGAALAQDADLEGSSEKFKQWAPALLALKNNGSVGETSQGLVEARKPVDAAGNKLISEENADREALFKALAAKNKTTPDEVRKNFVKFRFGRASDNHYFKGANGAWKTVKEWKSGK